jgi:phenylacetate-CoA ligase
MALIAGAIDVLSRYLEGHITTPEGIRRAAWFLELDLGGKRATGVVQEIQRRRLVTTIQQVARQSPFYREMFRQRNLNPDEVRTVEDLRRLPFTTSADLRNWRQFLCVPETELAAAHTTSGTTGEPKKVFFTYDEVQQLSNWGGLSLRFGRPGRMVAMIALPMTHGLWSGWASALRAIERAGGIPLPLGAEDTHETLEWIERFDPNIVISSPSFFSSLTQTAKEKGFRRKFDRILLSGEFLSERQKTVFHEYWGAEVVDCYGMTELGGGATLALPKCKANHLNDLHLVTEIVDPQTGEPAQDGEMVFTTLLREAMPLIRYRSGDRGRWAECPCALPFLAVTIGGRTDDMLVAGDMNIYGQLLQESLSELKGASGKIHIEVDKADLTDRMTLQVEGEGVSEDNVKEVLFHAYPELESSLTNGNLILKIEPNHPLADQRKALVIKDLRHH